MQEEKQELKVSDIKGLLLNIEKLKTARTDSQFDQILGSLNKLKDICEMDSLPQDVVHHLPDSLLISINFIMNHKQYPEKYLGDIEQYLKCILKYICRTLDHHNLKLSDIFRIIMDPVRMIYEYNMHQTDVHKSMNEVIPSYNYLLNPNYRNFIDSLQINQKVDSIKLSRSTNRMNWSRAIVTNIMDDEIAIFYLNDNLDEIIINKRSGWLMPYNTRSQDQDKLDNLQEGDIIVATQTDKWVKSTILNVIKTEDNQIQYQVGYRVYDDNGNNLEDTTNRRYIGYNRYHDELLHSSNPKLSLFENAHPIRDPKSEIQYIDDSVDSLYKQDYQQQQFYGILRPIQSKSMLLVRLINYFGEIGGFQLILEKLQNNQIDNWIPVDVMANLVQGIGNIHAQLYRYFAYDYIPNLTKQIRNNLLSASDQIIRNMGKEKMHHIVTSCTLLLDRIMNEEERKNWIQELSLDFVIVCFNCNFLDKKIMGLKLLSDMLKTAHIEKSAVFELHLLEWIKKNQILETLFNPHTHLQLLARSNDLIRVYLMIDYALSQENMGMIWNLMSQDDAELRPTIFKVMFDISVSMRDYHVEFFQNQVANLSPSQVLLEHIQFIYEINRYQIKNQDLVYQAIQILWKIIEYNSQFIEFPEVFVINDKLIKFKELEDKARQYICDLFKNLDSKNDQKANMIKQMVSNIQNNKFESSSLKTLSHLIASYPPSPKESYNISQEDVVKELILQKVPNIIRDSISNLRNKVKQVKCMDSDKGWPAEFQSAYMNKLQEKILLIKSFIRIHKTSWEIIDQTFLNLIWSEMIQSPFCKFEADVASNWLKDLIEKEKNQQFQEILLQFYEDNFTHFEHAANLTETAFECYSQLLKEMNQKKGFILKNDFEQAYSITVNYNALGQVTQMTNTNYDDEKPEPEYQVCVNPQELLGINYLWHIIYENNKSQQVQQKAAQLLIKLHLVLSVQMQSQKTQIISQFIEQIIQKLNNANGHKQTILRSILIIQLLLDESQTKGIGSLKSLIGLTKGDAFTLTIQNELTPEPKKPNLTVYSNETIMELRIKIAKLISTSWDSIKLSRANLFNQQRDIQDTDNGKTLVQIGIKKSENIIVGKRKTPPIPQLSLINEEGEMIEPFKEIVTKWYNDHSTDGKMTLQQMVDFTSKAAGDICQIGDSRISEFKEQYIKDPNDYIYLQDFISFYRDSAKDKQNVAAVWRNLHKFGYRNDLQNLADIQTVSIDEQSLPRALLASHDKFFQLMFGLLRLEPEIASECWKLLNNLPASSQVKNLIINLKTHQNWNLVFPQDEPYHLSYCLKVVEYLLGEEQCECDNEQTQIQEEHTESSIVIELSAQQQQQNEWMKDFINFGGFQQLIKIYQTQLQEPPRQINKQIQIFVLQVLKYYLAGALHTQEPKIYSLQQHVKQPVQATIEILSQVLCPNKESSEQAFQKVKSRAKPPSEYWNLVDNLKIDSIYLKILNGIDWKQQLQDCEQMVIRILSKEEIDLEDRQLIELGLIIITSVISTNLSDSINYFKVNQNNYQTLFSLCLFAKKQLLIRKYCSNAIFIIFKTQVDLGQFLIQLLLNIMPETENKDCQQYYEVLCKIIEECPMPNLEFYQNLGLNTMKQIQLYETTEVRSNQFNDKTLTGLLGILDSIAKVFPKIITLEFAQYLYNTCLFCTFLKFPEAQQNESVLEEFKPNNYVKCKSPESRKVVYSILLQYLRQDMKVLPQIMNIALLISQIPILNITDYKPQKDMKNYLGYVGLRNLGCTCYMNSMMQQFYMTPEFRYALLRASDGKELNMQKIKDNHHEYQIDDNTIHQFQRMLAYLEMTDRPDYNPISFCLAFKDYENKPVNVAVQQDAQEFLGQFFDKLDTGLKKTGWNQFIQGVYGGNTCSQMICMGCNNTREQIDLFYTLSVKVKGVKNIFESFDSMINGETIKDYYCENCQSKNDLLKRQCLAQLPNVLIVHLQRIVFNLDTFQNEKLSNKLEFPHQLNLSQYSREALMKEQIKDKEYYEYKLKGVVVHKGTAQYGHYYSLINHKQDKWIKFNDSIIEDFDIRKLSLECFGGKESEESAQEYWAGSHDTASQNAYILVYERLQKEQIKIQFENEDMKQEIMKKFNCQLSEGLEQRLEYHQLDKYIPQQLYQEVWWDNHRFMFERHIYNEDFFRFFKDLAEQMEYPSDYNKITQLEQQLPYCGIYHQYTQLKNTELHETLAYNLIFLITEVMSRASEHQCIKDMVLNVINLINLIPTKAYGIFKQLIADKSDRILSLLITIVDANIRQAISSLLLHLINVSIYIFNLTLDINILQILQTEDQTILCEQTIMKFLLEMIHKLPTDVAKNANKFTQYFTFFKLFVTSGITQLHFANQIELVSIFCDFFMEKGSPLWSQAEPSPIQFNFSEKKYQLSSKLSVPFYSNLFQAIDALLSNNDYYLSKNDLTCLQYQYFYQKAVLECQDLNSITNIVTRMAWENESVTRTICDVLLEYICKANYENLQPLLHISYHFLNIIDSLQDQRIEWMFGFPDIYYYNKQDYSTGCPLSLNEPYINFNSLISPMDSATQSILTQLFQTLKRFQNYSIQLLKFVLYSSNNIKKIFSYIINAPAPNYLWIKYVDWFQSFLAEYQEDALKFPQVSNAIFFNKNKELEETQAEFTKFENAYKQLIQGNPMLDENQNEPIYPLYIIGQTYYTEIVRDIKLQDGIYLRCYEHQVYLSKSQPDPLQQTNKTIDQSILYDKKYVQHSKIDPKCSVYQLFQQRNTCSIPKPPPLPKNTQKKDIVDGIDFSHDVSNQEQEKINADFVNELCKFEMELEAIPNPVSQNNTKMDVELEKDNNVIVAQPPEQKLYLDVDLIKCSYLRRYMIINENDQSVNVQFKISTETSGFINFRCPLKICKLVAAKSDGYLITLTKTIPELDWGEYSEQIDLLFSDQQQKEIKTDTKAKKQVRIDEEVQIYVNDVPTVPNKPGSDSMMNCPECTYLQSSSNHFCEVCTTPFK